MLLARCETDSDKCDRAGDCAGYGGAETEGQARELPADADDETRKHARDDARRRRLFPIERGEARQPAGCGIEAPGEHEDVLGILDI